MAQDIKESITAINKWHERYGFDVKAVVLHSMYGYYSGSIQWFKNPAAQASCHYCIKCDGEITMTVREEEAAWHSGHVTVTKEKAPKVIADNWGTNPNLISIGVEMEDKKNKNWDYPTPQYMATVNLVADICRRYKIEPCRDYIIMHREVDPINRSDPIGKWDHDKFCSDVAKLLKYDKPKLKVIPYTATVHVRSDITGLNVRSGPSTISPKTGKVKDYVLPKETVNVVGYVYGEEICGEPRWWISEYGNYFWMGGTVEKADKILQSGGDTNMTLDEKNALLAKEMEEHEARLAEISEQPVEEVVTEEMVAADPIVVEEPVAVEETVKETVEVVEPEVAEPVVETPADLPVEEVAVEDNTRGAVVEDYNAKLTAVEKELNALKSWIKQASMKIGVGF